MPPQRPRAALRFGGVCLAAFAWTAAVFLTTAPHGRYAGYDYDGVFYGALAEHFRGVDPRHENPVRRAFESENDFGRDRASLHQTAPWNRRILTPWIASRLPLETLSAFRWIAFVASFAALPILFLLLRNVGFDDGLALFGVFLYGGCFWTVRFSAFSPAYIDHVTQLFLLAILLLTVQGRYRTAAALLFLGGLQKEALAAFGLFAAAHYVLHRDPEQPWKRTAAWAALLIAAPALSVHWTRTALPAANIGVEGVFWQQLEAATTAKFWPPFLQSMFSGTGLVLPLLALRPTPWTRFLRARPEWIVYLLIALLYLFGGEDKSRLWLYFLPLGVMLALAVVQDFRERAAAPRCRLWLAVFLTLHLSASGQIPPVESFPGYLVQMVPEYAAKIDRGGGFLPFLAFDFGVALVFAAATALLLAGGAPQPASASDPSHASAPLPPPSP